MTKGIRIRKICIYGKIELTSIVQINDVEIPFESASCRWNE